MVERLAAGRSPAAAGDHLLQQAITWGKQNLAEDHLRALRDVSDILNHRSGIVAHARLRLQFERTLWYAPAGQYADSLVDPGNVQSFQKPWIGEVPMEAELTQGTTDTPGADAIRAAGSCRFSAPGRGCSTDASFIATRCWTPTAGAS